MHKFERIVNGRKKCLHCTSSIPRKKPGNAVAVVYYYMHQINTVHMKGFTREVIFKQQHTIIQVLTPSMGCCRQCVCVCTLRTHALRRFHMIIQKIRTASVTTHAQYKRDGAADVVGKRKATYRRQSCTMCIHESWCWITHVALAIILKIIQSLDRIIQNRIFILTIGFNECVYTLCKQRVRTPGRKNALVLVVHVLSHACGLRDDVLFVLEHAPIFHLLHFHK